MARGDKHARQARRAREEVEKALARGRHTEAGDALLALAAAERDDALVTRVRAAMTSELRRDRSSPTVAAWHSRVLREPRLLPADPAALSEIRWAFLVAALETRDFARARLELDALELEPRLGAMVEEFVSTSGRPASEAFAAWLGPEASARAPEAHSTPRRTAEPPRAPAEIDDRLMRCLLAEGPVALASTALRWAAAAPAELRAPIATSAALLLHRSLAERAVARDPSTLGLASASALLAEHAGHPPALEAAVSLALRAVARVGLSADLNDADWRSVGHVASAAARHDTMVGVLEILLSELAGKSDPSARRSVLEALRGAVEARPTAALLEVACDVLLLDLDHDATPRSQLGPDWFVGAMERALDRGVSFASWVERRPGLEPRATALAALLPVPLAVRWFDGAWGFASDDARGDLASAIDRLVCAMKANAASGADISFDEIREALAEADPSAARMGDAVIARYARTREGRELARELRAIGALTEPLPAEMRPYWLALEERAVPYFAMLLEVALELEPPLPRKRALLKSFWARRPTLVARLEALRQSTEDECALVAELLEAHLLFDYEADLEDAASALDLALEGGAPARVARIVASAFVAAWTAAQPKPSGERFTVLLRRANRLVGKRARGSSQGGRRRRSSTQTKAAQQSLFDVLKRSAS